MPVPSIWQAEDEKRPLGLGEIVQLPMSPGEKGVVVVTPSRKPAAPDGAPSAMTGAAATSKAGLSARTPAGLVSVTLTIYPGPTGAVFDTAKLPVTVPVEDIEQVVAGDAANSPDPAVRLKVQLREAPDANPPPVMLTVPSSVPYPGGAFVGDSAIVGPDTFWNEALPGLPLLGVTVTV